MYRHIYVPVDNSEHSNRAIDLAVELGQALGARLTGCHVYAARLHDYRFKQMEYTLPEEYKDEQELERQRKIHDSLIAMGLQLISDSYLDVMAGKAAAASLAYESKTFDGKHYKALIDDARASDYDLVIMGALGMGAVKDSQLGSVTERFVRKVSTDTLIVRNHDALRDAQGAIVVGLDGSPQSFQGLKIGIALAKGLGRPVHAVAVYDPYLHYAMFNGIVGVLNEKASKIFRFKEQEQLHEEIIDTGLAKIYQSHLEIGRKLAAEDGVDLAITLLDGKCFEKVLTFCRKEQPWLLILGRIGVHSEENEVDLGSNTENLLRLAPCNVLLTGGRVLPAARRQGRGDHFLDRGGRGPHGAGAAPGQGRGPDRLAALRHRAGPHRDHQQGDRRGHGHLHAHAHGREDADPGRGRGGGPAPRRAGRGDRHLLGVWLHRQGAEPCRDLSGLPRGGRQVPGRLPRGRGSHRRAGGRDRGGRVAARRAGQVVSGRPRRPARGYRRVPPPAGEGPGGEVRALQEDPCHHLRAGPAHHRGHRRPGQAGRRLGHAAGQDQVRAGRNPRTERGRRLHLDARRPRLGSTASRPASCAT